MRKSNLYKNAIVMKWITVVLMLCVSLMSNAQDLKKTIIKESSEKALEFVAEADKLLNLSDKQTKQIYQLRMELSMAIRIIYLQHGKNAKTLDIFKQAQHDFEFGMRKVLKEDQLITWNEYRKQVYLESQPQLSGLE